MTYMKFFLNFVLFMCFFLAFCLLSMTIGAYGFLIPWLLDQGTPSASMLAYGLAFGIPVAFILTGLTKQQEKVLAYLVRKEGYAAMADMAQWAESLGDRRFK